MVSLITTSQGEFIALHVWEIVGRKNLPISKGYSYSWLYDDFLKFSENWDKKFKLGPNPFILNLL